MRTGASRLQTARLGYGSGKAVTEFRKILIEATPDEIMDVLTDLETLTGRGLRRFGRTGSRSAPMDAYPWQRPVSAKHRRAGSRRRPNRA
jgi:hypothetical protein